LCENDAVDLNADVTGRGNALHSLVGVFRMGPEEFLVFDKPAICVVSREEPKN